MLTVLVANIKGGCGKTTIATHLAAAFARAGEATVIADVDRQRSSLGWLLRRPATVPVITGLDWSHDPGHAPKATARLVIDAPAALKTRQLEDLVDRADIVVLPVLPSAFDEDATRRFLGKLDVLKPIARHRKAVAVVGNRLRLRTRSAEDLDRFLATLGHQVVARLRDSQAYPEAAAAGLSLFDMTGKRAAEHRGDWAPLTGFITAAS